MDLYENETKELFRDQRLSDKPRPSIDFFFQKWMGIIHENWKHEK